jgi:hypothetical protein
LYLTQREIRKRGTRPEAPASDSMQMPLLPD